MSLKRRNLLELNPMKLCRTPHRFRNSCACGALYDPRIVY